MVEREMGSTLRLYFNYVPVGIIIAIVIKQIVVPVEGQLVISIPVLLGWLATAFAIKRIKKFFFRL